MRFPIPPALALLLTAAIAFAGCADGDDPDDGNGPGPGPTPTGTDPTPGNGAPDPSRPDDGVPDPVVIQGDALAPNPTHFVFPCITFGVDGDFHEIGREVDAWRFSTAPADAFALYWYNEDFEFLEGGPDSGVVPRGAHYVEVCMDFSVGPTQYTVTIAHPDHPDAAEGSEGDV